MKRLVFVFLSLVTLTACETPTSGGSSTCPTAEACFLASAIAADFQSQQRTNFGGDIILRRVFADGGDVVVDLGIPIRPSDLSPTDRQTLKDVLRASFLFGFCGEEDAARGLQPFFDVGGRYRVRTFGPGNDKLNDFIITTCQGVL